MGQHPCLDLDPLPCQPATGNPGVSLLTPPFDETHPAGTVNVKRAGAIAGSAST